MSNLQPQPQAQQTARSPRLEMDADKSAPPERTRFMKGDEVYVKRWKALRHGVITAVAPRKWAYQPQRYYVRCPDLKKITIAYEHELNYAGKGNIPITPEKQP